jgi:hypothetical protein
MEQVMKENIALLDNDNKQECLVHSRPLTPCIVPQAVERSGSAAARSAVRCNRLLDRLISRNRN